MRAPWQTGISGSLAEERTIYHVADVIVLFEDTAAARNESLALFTKK